MVCHLSDRYVPRLPHVPNFDETYSLMKLIGDKLFEHVMNVMYLAHMQEDDYVAYAKEMMNLVKAFEKPHGAATAICRQVNKPKGKAKAKAAAQVAS